MSTKTRTDKGCQRVSNNHNLSHFNFLKLPVTSQLHSFYFRRELDLNDRLFLQIVPDHHCISKERSLFNGQLKTVKKLNLPRAVHLTGVVPLAVSHDCSSRNPNCVTPEAHDRKKANCRWIRCEIKKELCSSLVENNPPLSKQCCVACMSESDWLK